MNKSVTLPEEQYSAKQLEGFADQTPDLQEAESFADFVCGTVYQQIYASPLPKIIKSNIKVDFQGIRFTDCMECVMRNLCNIATYDIKNKIFGAAPKESSLSSSLKIFYEAHSNVNDVAAEPAHQAWVNVVENVEGVAYNRLCTNSSISYAKCPSDCEGFIPMESVDATLPSRLISVGGKNVTVYEKQVGSVKYLLVPKNSDNFCCELMPSTRNVIVLMNQSLNLNLYPNQEATFEPGFENKYLPSMSQKFGWSVDSQSKDLTKGVNLKVSTESKHGFEIKLSYKEHGYVNIIENQKQSSQLKIDFEKGLPTQQAIATSLGLFDDKTNTKNDYYCDLQDPNRRVDKVIESMQRGTLTSKALTDNLVTSIGFLQDEHYLDRVFSSPPKAFSKEIKNTVLLRYLKYKRVYGIIKCVEKYKNPVLSKTDIVSIINDGLKREGNSTSDGYIELAKLSIRKGYLGASEILSIVNHGVKSSHSYVQIKTLDLAIQAIGKRILDESNKAEILSIINNGLKAENDNTKATSIRLASLSIGIDILDASDKADILSWINHGMKSSNSYIKMEALELAITAIRQNILGSSDNAEIISMINKGLKDGHYQGDCLAIATAAIEKGVLGASDKAKIISWINHGMKASTGYLPIMSLALATAAIENGVLGASDKADIISWINHGMKSGYLDVLNNAEYLKALVQNKYPDWFTSSITEAARGVGGFRGTPLNLMRKAFDQQMKEQFPEVSTESLAHQTSQNRFVPPSSEELSAQRNQMQRFNSGYDSSLHAGQAVQNILEQQRLVREQATQRSMNQQRLMDQKTFDASRLAAGALKVDGAKMKQLARSAIK